MDPSDSASLTFCEVCLGKGFWNAEDIRRYHKLYPKVCKASCGDHHRDPPLGTYASEAAVDGAVSDILVRLQELAKEIDARHPPKAPKDPADYFVGKPQMPQDFEDFKPSSIFKSYIVTKASPGFPYGIPIQHGDAITLFEPKLVHGFCYDCLAVTETLATSIHCVSCESVNMGNLGTFLALI